jgi:hypothetical protein
VVVVSDGFRADLIRRGVPASKVHTIRNGADAARFEVAEGAERSWRVRLGAGAEDCLVLYAGTHGLSQSLTTVADAAALVARRPVGSGVRFAFVGDGADKRRLESRVEELGLRNTVLLPGVPNSEMPGLLAAADVCLVPLRDLPLFASFIPSKLFEYLAAGKAVIGSVSGEAAQILAEAGAAVVRPGDSESLAAAIGTLAADSELRELMGKTGRAFVEENYSRTALARQYRKVLDLACVKR